jgi:hypothetical protein
MMKLSRSFELDAEASSSGNGSGRLLFFFYQPKIWELGVGQRRMGFMLSIQSKN